MQLPLISCFVQQPVYSCELIGDAVSQERVDESIKPSLWLSCCLYQDDSDISSTSIN
jgi:hypothetical protein